MNINFASMIGLITSIVLCALRFIDDKQSREKEKEYIYISIAVVVVSILYILVDSFFVNGIINFTLPLIQKHFYILLIYVLATAVAPSIVARREYSKRKFRAKKEYLSGNLKYNLLGAFVVEALLLLALLIIRDISALEEFYISIVMPALAPICVHMVLIYQKMEHTKDRAGELDHDASLKYVNQKLNLLYLFNTYFLGLTSVIYIVTYTIYCQMYHMTVTMNFIYLLILTCILIFFYILSQHPHHYLYLISIITIPIILIASVYWMSWLSQNWEIRLWQWIFVVLHSITYMLLIFRREGVVMVRRQSETSKTDSTGGGTFEIGKWKLTSKYNGLLYLPFVVAVVYGLIWILPFSTDRLPANEAYNYIDMICLDTDMEADDVIKNARGQKMYDEADNSFDVEKFMRYLSEELSTPLLNKGIIENEGDVPTRDILENRYLNAPRHNVSP